VNAATKLARSGALTLDWIDPADAFAALESEPFSLLLHGGSEPSRIYAFPLARIETDLPRGGFDRFAQEMRSALATGCEAAGLFAYECGGAFEAVPRAGESRWPDAAFGLYPAWAEFDPAARTVTVYGRPDAAGTLAGALSGAGASPVATPGPATWSARWSRERYLESCDRIIGHVRAGDIYQANLSQGFDVGLGTGDTPWAAFRRLIAASPAPRSAYFRLDADRVVMTNSPETFLTLQDGTLVSRPIKGTRPRGTTPEADRTAAEALSRSAKDRAENLMIVDLVRHDLARVCEAGSVRVPALCEPVPFANVHHLVSTVAGQLRAGLDALDTIAAAFPPGSITGAPKIRAMEIIAAEEGEARGPYCGTLGWIGSGGAAMDLNVMIRTAALHRDGQGWTAGIRSGGAITIGSDPADEYDETLAKASALRQAFAP